MKKSVFAGILAGCSFFAVIFILMGLCVALVASMGGLIMATTEFGARLVGPQVCPQGTRPELYSYPSTTTDENGQPTPTTAYELHCLDAGGNVVKVDTSSFLLVSMAYWFGAGLIVDFILALTLAVAIGALIGNAVHSQRPTHTNESTGNPLGH